MAVERRRYHRQPSKPELPFATKAMLFVAAKVSHLAHLPQGQPERMERAKAMIEQMDKEGFGNCTNQSECEAVCPKEISVRVIAEMNCDYLRASVRQGS